MSKFSEWLAAERGRVTKLAAELGITHSAIVQWDDRVPAERLGDVSRATGIPPEQLRPDIFRQTAAQ